MWADYLLSLFISLNYGYPNYKILGHTTENENYEMTVEVSGLLLNWYHTGISTDPRLKSQCGTECIIAAGMFTRSRKMNTASEQCVE